MASTSSQKASPSRSRTKRAAAADSRPVDEAAGVVLQDVSVTPEVAVVADAAAPVPAPAPARKRTRRPSARVTAVSATGTVEETPAVEVAAVAPEPVATPEPAPTPARAGRSTRARKTAAPAAPVAPVEAAPDVPAAAEVVRPARKRTRRPAAETPVVDAPQAVVVSTDQPAADTGRQAIAAEATVAAEPIAAAPVPAPASTAPAEPTVPVLVDTDTAQGADPVATPVSVEPAEPVEPVPAPAPLPAYSAVTLEDDGLRCLLRWNAGQDCPDELHALAAMLDTPTDAAPLANDLAVLELVQRARARRHPLRVDDAVWDWLAQARDMRERVQVLEQAHPDGPASAGLAALLAQPLRPYQAEAALYAACAGRCVIADDAGLGKTVEAIAALRLLARHFGLERALVLCPTERVADWLARWQAWVEPVEAGGADRCGPELQIVTLDALAADPGALAGCAADAVVVDEPADPDRSPWTRSEQVAALQALSARHAIALVRQPLDDRPAVLQVLLGWVDRPRFGALAVLAELDQRPDLGPAERAQVLAPWLLRRSKTQVLRQLPETVEQTVSVVLTPEARAGHDDRLDALRQTVRRWQRSQYLSDLDQRRLLRTLHALRLDCNGGKTAAALAQLDILLGVPDRRVVVFSQWPQSLAAVAEALSARGTSHLRLDDTLAGEARRAALAAFMADPRQRVLLCGDDGAGGHLGLRHAATALLHLDRPWNPAMLTQRLTRIHRTDRVRQVPVLHLIGADSLEARLQQAQDDPATRELFVGLIDGPQAEAFLDGARLTRLMQAVAAIAVDADTVPAAAT